jgi:lipopolysaccharide/colanic/teichoic acid biosynthesis glycosyltransferase
MGAKLTRGGGMSQAIKRLMDVVVASLGLVLLAPLLAILAIFIRLTMGGPVLFRQQRPGYRGRTFEIVKFRTMREAAGPGVRELPEELRITPAGRLLRRFSLDELPELWNILWGDMSLVGPRPLLMEYLPLYTAEQNRRHEVKPGLTGWAQVNRRRLLDMPERCVLDVWYVDHWSLALDLKILAMTTKAVLQGEGVEPVRPVEGSDAAEERRSP